MSTTSIYDRISQHAIVQRFSRTAWAAKITKYAIGSLVALTTSVVVFAVMDWLHIRTGIDSAAAFIAGAIPNWVLNRKWAWQMNGRVEWMREIVAYTIISVLVWAASTFATGHTQNWSRHHISPGDGLQVLVTTAAYVAVQAVFFVVKFVIYDKWVFAGQRGRTARRNRGSRPSSCPWRGCRDHASSSAPLRVDSRAGPRRSAAPRPGTGAAPGRRRRSPGPPSRGARTPGR
jgi:putative flippase GtrA